MLSTHSPLLTQYPRQDSDARADENIVKDSVGISVEVMMGQMLGSRLAEQCAEFCQSYSLYTKALLHYQEHIKEPITPPLISNYLQDQDFTAAIQSFTNTAQDAQIYMEAWKDGQDQKEALHHSLALAQLKMRKAAALIIDYYETLAPAAKAFMERWVSEQLEVITFLAGRTVIENIPIVLNAHEAALSDHGINYDDAPEEYCCSVSCRLMTNPVIVSGYVGENMVTNIYDQSTIDQLIEQHGDEAICPISQRNLSKLTITPDLELKNEIERWVLNQTRNSIRPK